MARSPKINSALDDALKEMGRPTTPEDLTRRGVRKLRAVGMREVSLLIERAVNRTLVERTLSVPPQAVAELVDAAQSEFVAQLEGLQDLADSRQLVERHRAEWRASLNELRSKVAERRAFIEQSENSPTPEALRARGDFERDLELLARKWLKPADRTTFLEEVGWLHARRMARERDDLRRAYDSELSLLERRLAKLVGSLEGAERALERAANSRAADLGIESVYREVQGLPSHERERELKAALMSSIFEANLALRTQRSAAGNPASS